MRFRGSKVQGPEFKGSRVPAVVLTRMNYGGREWSGQI